MYYAVGWDDQGKYVQESFTDKDQALEFINTACRQGWTVWLQYLSAPGIKHYG